MTVEIAFQYGAADLNGMAACFIHSWTDRRKYRRNNISASIASSNLGSIQNHATGLPLAHWFDGGCLSTAPPTVRILDICTHRGQANFIDSSVIQVCRFHARFDNQSGTKSHAALSLTNAKATLEYCYYHAPSVRIFSLVLKAFAALGLPRIPRRIPPRQW